MTLLPELKTIDQLLDDCLQNLAWAIEQGQLNNPLMVGIHSGGVWVAEALHQRLNLAEPLGKLNITFYRDDFNTLGLHPTVAPSQLPVDIDGRDIILVDDVLYTGRTIRAAMNELFDYGRPARIWLAVLFERDGRELPISAQTVGQRVVLSAQHQIHVAGPTPLTAHLVTREDLA
ncbi:MAG: bifunctional pyr operon transcriptional regulator/uracil phosphoribosyltransferase [Halothiobacillus sp. 24-54-40]|jgi:pyrimidine operon attenuation protein/uracil phosphoribosyltransferase|nr:bifunctional pyr operon transcriptional regulator/uracil phosphoribosyltransferase PyrR [Halothiobacillaceae bacterium]OYV47127.1 MAG: bifunctional pyr operon transcriptional regulator/uracil phosphoribosyltransferase [Halothiobacillus sp. 20-53-49]OYY40820.1 MAG: bifunctional pyr operon transcriptional regulator/uracil phosphoribosyltransferase [Halothiobacillus sp. 35-54-62]OYZ86300.1 MAG: bifunctional pyr operon transcriptional regulator/uracil phosphoribosyltransferase [Halothiobacillus s